MMKASFAAAFGKADELAARAASREFRAAFRARTPFARRLLGLVNPIGSLARMI